MSTPSPLFPPTTGPFTSRTQVPISYTIYQSGSTFYADALAGGTDYSGTVAATVIQNAWNAAPAGSAVFHKRAV
jgi:hypothetical protein